MKTGCRPEASYCSSNDAILAQELFRVQVEGRGTPIVVTHCGNLVGHFEFWSAKWYDSDVDMSFELILSDNAPDTPRMTFGPNVNSTTAGNVAETATTFSGWTP